MQRLSSLTPKHEVTRRSALKLIGGGIAALAAGCMARAGDEEIVATVEDPPEARPGTPKRYASMLTLDGFATGVIVEAHDGRPTKIDGNPAHPTGGGSLPWVQARILDLYDPHRSTMARIDGQPTTWQLVREQLASLAGPVCVVLPPQSSPSIARLVDRRDLTIVTDAPIDHRAAYRGAALVYGRALEVQPDLANADAVLVLDADFLAGMPMSAAWARAFANRRTPDRRMNRLWVVEPMETATGTLADERLAIAARDIAAVATVILAELHGALLPAPVVAMARARLGDRARWAARAAGDLATRRCAVIVGDRQPPIVHALARMIEHASHGMSTLTTPVVADPLGTTSAAHVIDAARSGAAVIVIDCNPVYSSPVGGAIAQALAAARFSLHVGLRRDQTAAACRAHVPLAHDLEAWSDARAWDGTTSIGQPVVRPRFDVASVADVIAALVGDRTDPLTRVKSGMAADVWAQSLRAGFVEGTREAPIAIAPTWTAAATAALAHELTPPPLDTIEIALARSPQLHDGRFAGNAWLQELPHPITKQTWGNAALVSPATAQRLHVDDGARLEIVTAVGRVTLPALVVPGAADDSITIELGHGQATPEIPIADRIGGSGYALRSEDSLIQRGAARAASGRDDVSRTQTTFTEHDRDVAPATTVAALAALPTMFAYLRASQSSLLPAQNEDGRQWGMSIDTSICTGCSACMVACQAENNIATVGPSQVAKGRHMNWLRIDRYVKDDGVVVNEPMPCQHCENAPCEYVCPVSATNHSHDGLNEQVYNRCIGTRFCSNNCPYKVRKFNWLAYEQPTSTRALQYNPDVTVRTRGVMEKCTYCVQRIRRAEQRALVEHRELSPGEVATACQQACPTAAIQFGDIHERGTAFSRTRSDARTFDVLHDLGTRPRTRYLAKIKNPRGER